MTLRLLHALALSSFALIAAASCSDDEEPTTSTTSTAAGGSTSTSGTGGSATLPEPEEHRPAGTTCTGEPPAGNPIPEPNGECMADGDCTDGDNGRCIWPYSGDNRCRYDECFEDADCPGTAACACRIEESFGFNRCFFGSCVVDADCGDGGWCSPSAVNVGVSCMEGISPGSVGFFCHTPDDECLNDSDCGEPYEAACLFSVDAMHWVCQDLLCLG